MSAGQKRRGLRFDSVGGASGDMILSVFVDLGVDLSDINAAVKAVGITGFELSAEPAAESGLHGTRVTVHTHHHEGHSHHRSYRDIRGMIQESGLNPRIRELSCAVFHRLAQAEGKIHRKPPEEVVFHEVGAVDSLVDIIGSCFCLDHLDIDYVSAGPLPVGQGTVEAAHGLLPVPAPATALLLKDHTVVHTSETVELVTPTGAALLATWLAACNNRPEQETFVAGGYGFGHRKLQSRPNLLRGSIMAGAEHEPAEGGCIVIETNTDDTVPELLGSLADRLLQSGALDVFFTPIQMKKHRPGTKISVLTDPSLSNQLKEIIFRETTTFGIREYPVQRTVLSRRPEEVSTPYGPVRVKIGSLGNSDITASPEHEDCAAIADKHGVAVRTVYEAALQAALSR